MQSPISDWFVPWTPIVWHSFHGRCQHPVVVRHHGEEIVTDVAVQSLHIEHSEDVPKDSLVVFW